MKVAFITLHRVFNYGSVLQAYATQKVLEDCGCDVEVIDYIPSKWQSKNLFFKVNKKRGFLKDNIYRFFRAFSVMLKQRTFWSFIKRDLKMTRVYKSFDELCANPPEADIYITGSDQVWNSGYCNMDKTFYLQFGDKSIKRIAYASSFGNEVLEAEEEAVITEYIKDYSAVSVREDSAVGIVNKMGMDATLVIDPTLQVSREVWINMSAKRLIKERYLILMLLYNEDNDATKIAREIADKKGLKLVKISWEMKKSSMVDKLMTHRTPGDFISLFNNADFVVTNSFHGLAFSINLNKQFVVIRRNEYNSRIESLLRLMGLEDRMVDIQNCMTVASQNIDYTPVNNILNEERKKTLVFLKENLK